MAHTGGAAEPCSADYVSDERWRRYRAEYETAKVEADKAADELRRRIACGAPPHVIAEVSRASQLASARLYTASACLLSPP